MANDAAATTTETEEEFIPPQFQLRKTFDAIGEQIDRIMKRARESEGATRDMLFELGGTVLPLFREAIGHIGGAIEWVDERLDEVEESADSVQSILLFEDGDRLEKILSQHARILAELLPETPKGSPQEEALMILERETNELIEWVKETTLPADEDEGGNEEEDEGDETDDEEPIEGSGIGEG